MLYVLSDEQITEIQERNERVVQSLTKRGAIVQLLEDGKIDMVGVFTPKELRLLSDYYETKQYFDDIK